MANPELDNYVQPPMDDRLFNDLVTRLYFLHMRKVDTVNYSLDHILAVSNELEFLERVMEKYASPKQKEKLKLSLESIMEFINVSKKS